jgi:hypothetical protein
MRQLDTLNIKFFMKKYIGIILFAVFGLQSCANRDGEIIEMLEAMQRQNEGLKVQISTLQNSANSALATLNKISLTQIATDKKIEVLQTDLKSVLIQLATISAQMAVANANTADLKVKLDTLQVQCAELVKKVEALGLPIISDNSLNQSLKAGLVAYYPFNGNANDLSINKYNGNVNGATLTTDRNGVANQAYLFADNQDITIPNSSKLNTYPLSVSLWYNVNRLGDQENSNIFSKYVPALWNGFQILLCDCRSVSNKGGIYNDGFTVIPWYLRSTNDKILGYYDEDSFLQKNISKNVWYHFVFIVDKSGSKIYVNGQLVDTDTWTGKEGASNNDLLWKIGGLYHTWFNGKIDDVGVWNRALSETEIGYLYSSNFTF